VEIEARLTGELESRKPPQVTTNVSLPAINAQVASQSPDIIRDIARHKRLPTEEERQKLLGEGNHTGIDEPGEKD